MKIDNELTKEKLIKKLSYWYDNSFFDKVIDKVLEIPKEKRDYETVSYLIRAYNSVNRFQSAIKELDSIKQKGESDPYWHFRLGYAYLNIENFEDALKEYETAHSLDKNDRTIKHHFEVLKVNLFLGKNFLEDEENT
ncbi:hypothetical protein SDC9_23993 [bioreactor metagenome]|uniref:Tetratricopeptide repeat protein n=1 Tax=bioreactor metagenome TaxID=1076179 RepID=A0A644UGX7_9ZZZZ|nr:tetratricopeptide repeat protein [Methanobrevibacter sp.]MEA4957701.1 tetratricopeptide repeat protein [Methanobrevibacter sp.]